MKFIPAVLFSLFPATAGGFIVVVVAAGVTGVGCPGCEAGAVVVVGVVSGVTVVATVVVGGGGGVVFGSETYSGKPSKEKR